MNIALIGFMATGKTSVGKELARLRGMHYSDTDALIEQEAGITISEIFNRYGEKYFRDLETKIISQSVQLDNQVITLGGGAVLRPENMDVLERNSIIVCLTATPEVIYERVKDDTTRPLLQVPDPQAKIRELLTQRAPYYQRCNLMVDTSELTIPQIVARISVF